MYPRLESTQMYSDEPGLLSKPAMMYPVYSSVHPGRQVLVPGIMTAAARGTRHTAQAGVSWHSSSGQMSYSEP